MNIEEILEELDLDIDNRLQRFSNKQLREILTVLAENMSKKELTNLLCDDNHFASTSLIRLLEKHEKKLLFQILNEPKEEPELRIPLENWLKELEYKVSFEVPYKIGKRRRIIDVLGWQNIRYLERGLLSGWKDKKFIAIESKIKTSRGAIDKAFSQANDYSKCAQYCCVAISPYMFYKYSDIIMDKIDRNENIGVLLVDKSRVIQVLSSAEETDVDRETFEYVKEELG